MTTWVPTHASNLWVICPGSALSYSCAMHADHPWDVTLTSLLFPRGSLIVTCPTASSTPHAWTFCDLDFSLTECWNVAWKLPFFFQLSFTVWIVEVRGLHAPHLDVAPSSAALTRELTETLARPASLSVDPVFWAPP